jgi:predicted MFS family arabinose efflux permease
MTSASVTIIGISVMVGSVIYGYYRDPYGTMPVILMIAGFVMMMIGLGATTKQRKRTR